MSSGYFDKTQLDQQQLLFKHFHILYLVAQHLYKSLFSSLTHLLTHSLTHWLIDSLSLPYGCHVIGILFIYRSIGPRLVFFRAECMSMQGRNWGGGFYTLAKDMSLNRGATHFKLGPHVLSHTSFNEYTCTPSPSPLCLCKYPFTY